MNGAIKYASIVPRISARDASELTVSCLLGENHSAVNLLGKQALKPRLIEIIALPNKAI